MAKGERWRVWGWHDENYCMMDHSICMVSLYLKHHSLVAELFSMSWGTILVWKTTTTMAASSEKGGGAMRGPRQRINSKNASTMGGRGESCKEKQYKIGWSRSSDGGRLYRARTAMPSGNGTLNLNRHAIPLIVIRRSTEYSVQSRSAYKHWPSVADCYWVRGSLTIMQRDNVNGCMMFRSVCSDVLCHKIQRSKSNASMSPGWILAVRDGGCIHQLLIYIVV